MSEKAKFRMWLVGIAVFGIAMFKLIPYLITTYQFGSQWIAVLLILLVLIIPQVTAQKNLRILEDYLQTGEVDYDVPIKFTDYIPFVNDWELTRLYNDGELINRVISLVVRVTTITIPLALLYLNLLVVWVDLGYNGTMLVMNALTYSLIIYFIARAALVIHLLISVNANFWYSLILGATHVVGFMYLGYMAKVFIMRQGDAVYEQRLGEEFE